MEDEETEECEIQVHATVDFSNKGLRKIDRAIAEHRQATTLLINDNEVQRLDNVDSYSNLKKLSLINNQLVRMYGVSQLIHLEVLDLTNNSLVTIEGLKELRNLSELYIGKNKIKVIEHINNNLNLKKLDVSENNVAHITDISFLVHLKELHLHGNKLTNIRQCEKYFPENIQVLTLHNNLISDLNEISHLMQFSQIKELTFSGNPCVNFSNSQKAFNYRPFIKNWCSNLLVLDNLPLDDIECLKAEWLYSQGRGRSFRSGEQAALAEYLVSVCPAKEPNDETEDVKKLRLILSKAQQHQKQLKEQLSAGNLSQQSTNKVSRRKKMYGLPERMVTSYQDSTLKNCRNSPDLMTKSLDSGISRHCPGLRKGETHQTPLQTSSTFIPIPDALISPDACQKGTFLSVHPGPPSLSSRTSRSSSKTSPHSTPESKRKSSATSVKKKNEHLGSPSMKSNHNSENPRSSTPIGSLLGSQTRATVASGRGGLNTKGTDVGCTGTSDEDDHEVIEKSRCQERFRGKRNGKIQRDDDKGSVCLQKRSQAYSRRVPGSEASGEGFASRKAWNAALCIQRWWRGYRVRNLDGRVVAVFKDIQMIRMQEYITKVISEMEATKMALEGNRKLQVLQMQAINALWKKLVAFQSNDASDGCSDSRLTLQQLMTTCSNLNKQVEGLQTMMKTLYSSNQCRSAPIATQTDIVAVHTPQGDEEARFPYNLNVKRAGRESCMPSDQCCETTPGGSDIVEIYTTNNLEGSLSDQEIFLAHHLEIVKKGNCTNAVLSKPLPALNEILEPDLSGSEIPETQDRHDGVKDVGHEQT